MSKKRKWYLIYLYGCVTSAFVFSQIFWYFKGEWLNATIALLGFPFALGITIRSYHWWQFYLKMEQ